MRTKTARLARLGLLLTLCFTASGCVWLQNEFFVYDVAPAADEQPAGAAARD